MRIVWYIWGAYMLYGWKIRIYEGSEKFRIPLHEYTLMPTHMMDFFSPRELESMERHEALFLYKKLSLLCRLMRIRRSGVFEEGDYLFDLWNDPGRSIRLYRKK